MTDTKTNLPANAVSRLPVISAEAYSHVGKYAGALVLAAFEHIGGVTRLAQWADENPSDFYTKLMPKIISRSQQVDVSGTVTIDDAIGRLERIEEAEFDDVEEDWDL